MSLIEVDDLLVLRRRLADADVPTIELDLSGCGSKADLMMRCDASLQLPAGFGGNWDALFDVLRDRVLSLVDQRGVGAVIFFGTGDLTREAPEVVRALQGTLFDLTSVFPAERCLVYWVVPTSPKMPEQ